MTDVKFDDFLRPTLPSLLELQDSDEHYIAEVLVLNTRRGDAWVSCYYPFPDEDSALRYVQKNYSKDRIKAVRVRFCKVVQAQPFPSEDIVDKEVKTNPHKIKEDV